MTELLEIGQVARAHGLRGEVVVKLVTNRLERVAPGAVLEAESPAPGVERRQLRVMASSPHLGRHIVVFEGVSSRDSAEALHGWRLFAEPLEAADGEPFVHELIGSELFEISGERRGVITSVEANPASDLLVVDQHWYVPLRFVVEHTGGRVVVDAPNGLFE